MRAFIVAVFLALVTFGITAVAAEKVWVPPYVGEWSNGRGEALFITAHTVQFANNKPVPFRDITRAGDNHTFTLMITSPGPVNYFSKFLFVSLKDKTEMRTESYNAPEDQGSERASTATWYRDK